MSIFRRLSISLMGGASSSGDDEPRTPSHRHRHSLHRPQKNYDVSPTGGNRPISITADPRVSFGPDVPPRDPSRVLDGPTPPPPHPPPPLPPQPHRSSHHRHHRSDAGERPRKHRPRSDGDPARPPRSSRSRHRRSEIPADFEPVSPIEVPTPLSAPIPISASNSNSNSNRIAASPTGGSSMGIIISGHHKRRGSASSTPLITATPPTPSPLEQARRANTHPGFYGFPGGAPPPYPVTPPESRNGEQYIAYAVSKMAVGVPEHDSLLHRYRSAFDPHAGRAELSAEPEPVEIGSSDAPPPPPPLPAKPRRTRGSLRENQYDFLRTFDTVFVIDDSASMDEFTRWRDTRAALETIATIATKYDADGIDVFFLNSTQHSARNVRSADEVRRLFDLVQPGGITPIAACLDRILRRHLDRYSAAREADTGVYPKPLNIIVLTDGEPTDDPESVIVDAARRLEALNAPLCQVGIQFFQIGDEEGAREALEELDDALAGLYGIRDMVDYTPYIGGGDGSGEDGEAVTGEWILKVLTGAVNRRLDRMPNDHGFGRGG